MLDPGLVIGVDIGTTGVKAAAVDTAEGVQDLTAWRLDGAPNDATSVLAGQVSKEELP